MRPSNPTPLAAESSFPLRHRTAVITGSCGDGIGRSTAMLLGRLGCNVMLNYGTHRRGSVIRGHATRIMSAIKKLGGDAAVCCADTRKPYEVDRMVQRTMGRFGGVDYLILNAGADWVTSDITDISYSRWRSTLAAEIDGVFLPMKYIVPMMRARGEGRIIIIGLLNALQMHDVDQMAPDYCLGRAVRAWLTTALSMQEFKRGISINLIEPGYIHGLSFEAALEFVTSGRDIRATQSPEPNCHDVAEIVAFLCSREGRHLANSILRIPTDILPIERPEIV